MRSIFLASITLISGAGFGQSLEATFRKIVDLPSAVKESSGIITAGVDKVWTHSDSGYENELYLVDTIGALLRTLVIDNATNMDWEDVARDADQNIWINDAGNNGNGRTDLTLYRISNPDVHSQDTVQAEILTFTFSDQTVFPPGSGNMNFDIEAMVWLNDSLFLFTKNRSMPFNGYSKMYGIPAQPGTGVAYLLDSIFVDSDIQRGRITAADIDTATGTIALLTRSMVLCFVNYPGTRFFDGVELRYYFNGRVDQVEALAFINSRELYMTDEGSPDNNIPGALYKVTLSSLLSTQNNAPLDNVRWYSHNEELVMKAPVSGLLLISSVDGKTLYSGPFKNEIRIPMVQTPRGMYVFTLTSTDGKVVAGKYIH